MLGISKRWSWWRRQCCDSRRETSMWSKDSEDPLYVPETAWDIWKCYVRKVTPATRYWQDCYGGRLVRNPCIHQEFTSLMRMDQRKTEGRRMGLKDIAREVEGWGRDLMNKCIWISKKQAKTKINLEEYRGKVSNKIHIHTNVSTYVSFLVPR
jgi:hypothetical protein